jgi:hypothetical protein
MKKRGKKGFGGKGKMVKGALKKGGAHAFSGPRSNVGAKPGSHKQMKSQSQPMDGALGAGGTKLGGNRARARDKRLQNAQL